MIGSGAGLWFVVCSLWFVVCGVPFQVPGELRVQFESAYPHRMSHVGTSDPMRAEVCC